MAITISWMLQKGGVGKSTQTGIMAWLLAKRGKRVLVVDMDSQGNVSSLLSQQDAYSFSNETVLEAVEDNDARSYIFAVSDTLHLLPADDLLATYDRRIMEMYASQSEYGRTGHPVLYLGETLTQVSDEYDYILIDCPPSLNQQTVSALAASNYVVTVLQTEVYAFQALNRFFETLFHVKRGLNPELTMIGISAGLMDRYALQTAILESVQDRYGKLLFHTVLRRLARISEFATVGISDATKDQRHALAQYGELLDEVLERISEGFAANDIYFEALQEHLAYVETTLESPLPDKKRERFEELCETLTSDIAAAKEWS